MIEKQKKLFVTGASGFLGRHFIINSSRDNFEIHALTRNKNKLEHDTVFKNVNLIEGDIRKIDKYLPILSACDYFIHIAGEKTDISKMEEVNVNSMKRILSVLSSVPSIRLMYISSSGVYGIENHPEKILTEDKACYPLTKYEKTKLDAENCLIDFSKSNSLNYVILRPSNVFGEFDKSKKFLNLIKSLKKGLFFYINKNAMVNYVYVKYVTDTMLHFIRSDRFNNEIYNINTPVKLEEIITLFKSELNIDKKTNCLPNGLLIFIAKIFDKFPGKFQIFSSEKYFALTNTKIYSIQKIKSEFANNENEILRQGFKNLVNWYKRSGLL